MAYYTINVNIEKLEQSVKELRSRLSQCECQIANLNNYIWGSQGPANQISHIRDTVDNLSMDVNDFKNQLVGEICELRADLNVQTDNPNKKSNLEILEQNGRKEAKEYIDLDDIADGKGLWELYDENWWNK